MLVKAANVTTTTSLLLFIAMLVASFLGNGVSQKPLYRQTSAASRKLLPVTLISLLIWVAVAIPRQPQIANKYTLERMLKAENYSSAIIFASGKTRQDFPQRHYLPPEPSSWFPLELLDQLTPTAPAWLREEWIGNAIESHVSFSWPFDNEAWAKISPRYPQIAEAAARHTEDLHRQADALTPEESGWLHFHLQRLAESAKAAEPSPAESP